MPRYFFDVRDGSGLYPDEEGLELSDLRAAEKEAAASLADMTRDAVPRMERQHMGVAVREGDEPRFQMGIVFYVNRSK